jgi:hypothetical protein
MKLVTLAFLALLVLAHANGEGRIALARPLSLFREEAGSPIGWVLFGLLLAAGVILVQLLLRMRWFFDAFMLLVVTALLAFVAATPSLDSDHLIVSGVLLLSLYLYYALLFHRLESRWLWLHLPMPVLLLFLTQRHSYGLWQKSLILYYLLVINLQYSASKGWLEAAKSTRRGWEIPKRDSQRTQKVYKLDV